MSLIVQQKYLTLGIEEHDIFIKNMVHVQKNQKLIFSKLKTIPK